MQTARPIDVITLFGADGEVRPLRIRAEEEAGERIRGNICEILCQKENLHIGAESKTFLCRVQLEGRSVVLELKYLIRSQNWLLMRRLY